MLVDLARNDVGRVVEYGTEKVDEMMILERYSHVMHLTSQVSGDLAEGLGPIDVLKATLPAGTVSGAPKVRAMEIIDDLEPTKRGPYAGVVGYLDFSGNIDTAIAIRTMVCLPDGRACVQAGAGVVADSVPAHEDLECHNKAKALLAAVPAARRMTADRLAPRTRRNSEVRELASVSRACPRRLGPAISARGAGSARPPSRRRRDSLPCEGGYCVENEGVGGPSATTARTASTFGVERRDRGEPPGGARRGVGSGVGCPGGLTPPVERLVRAVGRPRRRRGWR